MAVTQEYVIQALRKKGYKGEIPGEQQVQPSQNVAEKPQSQGLIPDLLNKISPGLAITVAQGARGWQAAGGQPTNPENDYQKLIFAENLKRQSENDPNSLDYQTKQANINFTKERTKLAEAGYVQDENGKITKVAEVKPESSTERIFKRKELDELAAEAENTRQQSGLVENAIPAIQNIDRGFVANAKRSWNKFFGQDNPDLADWQSLKSILTGIQLDMSDRTKGAISDREMETFQKAVANDDFATAMQQTKVLNAYYNKIHGRLDSKMSAYEDMFNEDPRQFRSMQNLPVRKEGLFGSNGNSGGGQTKSGNSFRKVS